MNNKGSFRDALLLDALTKKSPLEEAREFMLGDIFSKTPLTGSFGFSELTDKRNELEQMLAKILDAGESDEALKKAIAFFKMDKETADLIFSMTIHYKTCLIELGYNEYVICYIRRSLSIVHGM